MKRLLALGCGAPLPALEQCKTSDLVGAVGFYATGFVLRSPVTNLTGPFARLGRFESDGKGNLTFTSTASFNGNLIPQDFSGRYTMNPDCTFISQVSLPDPINLSITFFGVLSDEGNEIRDLFVSPDGIVVYGTGRKQHLENCTNRSLAGAYQVDLSGTLLQPGKPRLPFSGVGRIQADGKGGFEGKLGSNHGGLALHEAISGTYTVASDCTFQLKYYTGGEPKTPGGGVTLKGVFIDGDRAAYLMVVDPGAATVLGFLKHQ